jgi:hypothetical protein
MLSTLGGGAERQVTAPSSDLTRRAHDVHVVFVYSGIYAETKAGTGCQFHRVRADAQEFGSRSLG